MVLLTASPRICMYIVYTVLRWTARLGWSGAEQTGRRCHCRAHMWSELYASCALVFFSLTRPTAKREVVVPCITQGSHASLKVLDFIQSQLAWTRMFRIKDTYWKLWKKIELESSSPLRLSITFTYLTIWDKASVDINCKVQCSAKNQAEKRRLELKAVDEQLHDRLLQLSNCQ